VLRRLVATGFGARPKGLPVKLVTIVGARPQFIKAAAVSRALARTIAGGAADLREVIVHTGQHFDRRMSQVFFDELAIPPPHLNLGIASLSHGAMTGRMLEAIEKVLLDERPDLVMVYGDTNSTLAGALAAAKLHMPVAHVEAGLRSFNRGMPEEVNRLVADRLATLLFCPSETAVANLRDEGIRDGVYNVGDVMFDALLYHREAAIRGVALGRWRLAEKAYVVATVHRAENTDDPARLAGILEGLGLVAADAPVVLPLHPRTRGVIRTLGLEDLLVPLRVTEPLSFLEMVRLEASARAIFTDSGGVQKEALYLQVPCVTLRDETEWVETVELGWNRLVGSRPRDILAGWRQLVASACPPPATPYGGGHAAELIVEHFATFGAVRSSAAGVRPALAR